MQLTKRLIPSVVCMLTALAALTPRNLSSQFSDSTIKEINERLIELHECRQKQALYIQLAHTDSLNLHKQATIITNQQETISQEKGKNKILRRVNAVQFALLILALIL